MLQKLQTEQATAVQSQEYPASSCPICFEDLAQGDAAATSPRAASDVETGMAGAHRAYHFNKEDGDNFEAGMAGAHSTHHSNKEDGDTFEAGMAGTARAHHSNSGCHGIASSRKVAGTPSAPSLDSHPEYESLLGDDREMLQDEHKTDMWAL